MEERKNKREGKANIKMAVFLWIAEDARTAGVFYSIDQNVAHIHNEPI